MRKVSPLVIGAFFVVLLAGLVSNRNIKAKGHGWVIQIEDSSTKECD
jgi:hypothetical protein